MKININDLVVRLADRCAFEGEDLTTTTGEIKDLIRDIEREGKR